MSGFLLFEDGEESVDKPVKRGGVDAFGITDRIVNKAKWAR